MQKPRKIARELALLSLSQLRGTTEDAERQLSELIVDAIRTLTTEIQDTLENAAAELKRGSDRLLNSETRASDLHSARVMVNEAIDLTETAINRLGRAVDLPEFLLQAGQREVREYTLEVVGTVHRRRQEIDQQIEEALVDWQLKRLPRIDRDILRIAVAEMMYLGLKEGVAINEAVELAKRYSDEEGRRFINGVLRRVTDRMKAQAPLP